MTQTKDVRPDCLLTALLSLQLLLLAVTPAISGSEIYRYTEQHGVMTTFFDWQLHHSDDDTVTIISRGDRTHYINVCEQNGATISWRMQGKDTDISARREDNTLFIAGSDAGKAIDRKIILDDLPWFQPLSYSLRHLLARGNGEKQRFWMIRPDTLKPQKFQATRDEMKEITIGNDTFAATRVTIRPDGMLAGLWQASYWFRAADGLFLRYEGIHGLPGTAKTIITLIP
ncbi:MAG: hypothetical protein ACOY4H_00680 [Thermodesulfobacteriota bacterium]